MRYEFQVIIQACGDIDELGDGWHYFGATIHDHPDGRPRQFVCWRRRLP